MHAHRILAATVELANIARNFCRARIVPITTAEQRAVLDRAHRLAGAGSLIPPHKTYIEQRNTYDGQCQMADLNKMHGLKHHYARARTKRSPDGNRRWPAAPLRGRSHPCNACTIERQVEQFLDRIADTDVPSIVAAYEKRIRDLEERKIVLAKRIANCGRALPDFDDALKTPLDFLRNPGNLWIHRA